MQNIQIKHSLTEIRKYAAEQRKLEAEAENCVRRLWRMVVISIAAGAVLFGAGPCCSAGGQVPGQGKEDARGTVYQAQPTPLAEPWITLSMPNWS